VLELLLAASGTALATGLGAIPVFMLGDRAADLRSVLLGLAAGVMAVASIAGLLQPALDRGSSSEVIAGVLIGAGFLFGTRRLLTSGRVGVAVGGARTALLVFLVLLVHSLPEGFAIGTAYSADAATIGLFVVIAIAIQNVPEGTSVAIPLAAQGASRSRQFWAAVLSSVPQPIGAAVAFLLVDEITALLPLSFGFAAGAMLTLIAVELLPEAWGGGRGRALLGLAAGSALMWTLAQLIAV
jgi:zinc transporter, ZIP family